jgi:hypothetical protein
VVGVGLIQYKSSVDDLVVNWRGVAILLRVGRAMKIDDEIWGVEKPGK